MLLYSCKNIRQVFRYVSRRDTRRYSIPCQPGSDGEFVATHSWDCTSRHRYIATRTDSPRRARAQGYCMSKPRNNLGNHRLMHSKQHKFKQPAKPLEPPTPRTSVLGLDRLAKEKREASTSEDGSRKRQKLDSEKLFKGASLRDFLAFPHPLHHNSSSRVTWTPSRTLTTTRGRNPFAPGRFVRGWQEETRGVPAEQGEAER